MTQEEAAASERPLRVTHASARLTIAYQEECVVLSARLEQNDPRDPYVAVSRALTKQCVSQRALADAWAELLAALAALVQKRIPDQPILAGLPACVAGDIRPVLDEAPVEAPAREVLENMMREAGCSQEEINHARFVGPAGTADHGAAAAPSGNGGATGPGDGERDLAAGNPMGRVSSTQDRLQRDRTGREAP